MALRQFLQERLGNQHDPESAIRARALLQYVDALRNGQPGDVFGVAYDAEGDVLVPAILLLDIKEHGKKTVSVTLPDGSDATAKVLGSDAMRGLSVIKLDTPLPATTALAADKPVVGELLMAVSANTGAVTWITAPASASAQPRRGALAEDRFPITSGETTGMTLLFNVNGELAAAGFDHYALLSASVLQPELESMKTTGWVNRRQVGFQWSAISADDRDAA